MRPGRRLLAPLVAVTATAAAVTATFTLLSAPAQAATTTLCASQTAPVAGGAYIVENNEWNSTASECVTTDGNADFTVANSAISNSGGAPGGYPAIYKGCHWGLCSSNSGLPLPVSGLAPGTVTTSWNTTQTGQGVYDVAYDIWFNQSATTAGQPNAEEMMVWLNHTGNVQPSGSVVASNVSIGGHTYNVWEAQDSTWKDVSYVMTSPATSVSNLDVGVLAADSISRGYLHTSDYLIDLEAGFELWQGGAGLTTNSYSVSVNGSGPSTSPSASASASPSPSPTPTTGGTGGCSGAYTITNSWQGGFQGQLVVTDNGTAPTTGWKAVLNFPASLTVSNLWNGSYTQSGQQVTITNASYNGVLSPGGSTTVGFTATDGGSSGLTPTVACSAG